MTRPALDPQQRIGRITVALVVAVLVGALGIQTVRAFRGDGALAAPADLSGQGTTARGSGAGSGSDAGADGRGSTGGDESGDAAGGRTRVQGSATVVRDTGDDGTDSAGDPGDTGDTGTAVSDELADLGDPVYTFVSAPDLLNADIGDIRSLPTWREGMPNSDNKTDEDSLRRLYTEMASWNPDAVLVAGDEVRGHWDQDGSGLGIFGPVGTDAEKLAAITRAADFYYPAWKARFPTNGIALDKVYPAIGDHEIGDNPWPEGSFALSAVPTFKQLWADHFTTVDGGPNRFDLHPTGTSVDGTAYATYLTPKLLLVSIDTFLATPGSMRISVGQAQLDWLRETLAAAPDDAKIIVQGHVPVLTPVRTRGSSSLHLEYGGSSELWQVLKQYGVDLYLNGEVHDFTATQLEDHEPIQVSHGGLFAHGTTGYVIGRIYADGTTSLEAREMPDISTPAEQAPRLWQTRNNLQWKVRFPDHSDSVGTMVIDPTNHIVSRTGVLEPYEPGVGTVVKDTEDDASAEE